MFLSYIQLFYKNVENNSFTDSFNPCEYGGNCTISDQARCRRMEMMTGVRTQAVCCKTYAQDDLMAYEVKRCMCDIHCRRQGGKPGNNI